MTQNWASQVVSSLGSMYNRKNNTVNIGTVLV